MQIVPLRILGFSDTYPFCICIWCVVVVVVVYDGVIFCVCLIYPRTLKNRKASQNVQASKVPRRRIPHDDSPT